MSERTILELFRDLEQIVKRLMKKIAEHRQRLTLDRLRQIRDYLESYSSDSDLLDAVDAAIAAEEAIQGEE